MNPVQSVKNQRNTTSSILANTNQVTFVTQTIEVRNATKITGLEVPTGSTIYSIYIEWNFVSGSASATGTVDWVLVKLRSGQDFATLFTTPNWTDLGLSDGRNQILLSHSDIFGTEDAGPIRYKKRVKIPKIYQRQRAGDQFAIVSNSSEVGTLSVNVLYKYFN